MAKKQISDLNRTGADAPTVNEQVYFALKHAITLGEFAPGARLRFEELKERFKTSVSSLREALSRLASDGLVVMESHKGAAVAPMDAQDFRDLIDVRKLVEVQCIRNAIEHGNDQWEADLVAAFHIYEKSLKGSSRKRAGDTDRTTRHNGFHAALVSACTSQRLLWMRGLLYAQAERYLVLSFKSTQRPDSEILAEHAEILNAALHRKDKQAASLIESHIEKAAEVVLPLIRKAKGA
jgi:GntR family transcriptional regulator, carbon starvation induced regulator